MKSLLLIFFLLFMSCISISSAEALVVEVGQQIEVRAISSLGVPIHRTNSSSLMGRTPDGSVGDVLEVIGSWLRVKFPTIEGWITVSYVSRIIIPSGPTEEEIELAIKEAVEKQQAADQVIIDGLNAQIGSLDSQIASLEASSSQLELDLSESKASNATLTTENQTLTQQAITLLGENADLKLEIDGLKSSSETLQLAYEALVSEIDRYRTPLKLPALSLTSKVGFGTDVEIPAPEGATSLAFLLGQVVIDPNLHGPWASQWSPRPIVDGKVQLSFVGYIDGPSYGTIRFFFPNQPPVDQPLEAFTERPSTIFGDSTPLLNSGTAVTTTVDKQVELGVVIKPKKDIRIVGLRFYKGNELHRGPYTGAIWTTGGQKITDVQFHENDNTVGWKEIYFYSPVIVTSGTEVIISYNAPAGWTGQTGVFGTDRLNPVAIVKDDLDVLTGIYSYTTTEKYPFPTVKHTTNYYADILYIPLDPVVTP